MVVASLVRSNDKGQLGFLREPERVNVLVSRARDGLILIGNAHTLCSARSEAARSHWEHLLSALEAAGAIHPGLPAVCQRHGTAALPPLDSPDAFFQRSPDGGCCQPCGQMLPCGHACALRCHATDPEHLHVQCRELVYGTCAQNHISVRECWQSADGCRVCSSLERIKINEWRALERKVRSWGICNGVYMACVHPDGAHRGIAT